MSTLILSLLLVFLLFLGLVMPQPMQREYFANHNQAPPPGATMVSPALGNMLAIPPGPAQQRPAIDALSRDTVVQNASGSGSGSGSSCKMKKKECPVCPDMSKYVKLDEVPCWNCTLP
jgi:hypothetical protein